MGSLQTPPQCKAPAYPPGLPSPTSAPNQAPAPALCPPAAPTASRIFALHTPPRLSKTHLPSHLLLCSRRFSGTFLTPKEVQTSPSTHPGYLPTAALHCPTPHASSVHGLPQEKAAPLLTSIEHLTNTLQANDGMDGQTVTE